ncbi:SIS domain-containing protein [Leptolyngbya sp. FACHB-261]|uniref:SIS domain-containing protein n=1 Tax=Leptolyngbya sp. FACHB-261 TaxID=2692806 RepID=UPI001688C39D|nr:SIS domain-containing protein [Leptolyngbya sp. FACHB-261]MBD2102434.1 SIS domain-containing protein [Leptolyngbya sp. FACHB-261]
MPLAPDGPVPTHGPSYDAFGQAESHMLQEIREQPSVLQACLDTFLPLSVGTEPTLKLGLPDLSLDLERVHILACGSSYHAALLGKHLLEQWAGLSVEVQFASEHAENPPRPTPNTLILAISQSGESSDTLRAVQREQQRRADQFRLLAITNRADSSLARLATHTLLTPAGPEVAIAATKSFTAQLMVLYVLALELAQQRQQSSATQVEARLRQLSNLPAQVQTLLTAQEQATKLLAEHLATAQACIFLGRGLHYPIALEGALKLRETAYLQATGYPTGEFRHGPIASVSEQLPVVLLAVPGSKSYQQTLDNAQELKARGAYLIGVTSVDHLDIKSEPVFDHVLPIASANAEFAPLLSVVPLQLLAYFVALQRNLNVDRPRHLTKAIVDEAVEQVI